MKRSILLLLTLLLLACGGPSNHSPAGPQRPGGRDLIEFTGRIVYVPLEGGFYGILADDGQRYDPLSLPEPWRQDGLQVRVKGRLRPGSVGFHMWGMRIEILHIEAL